MYTNHELSESSDRNERASLRRHFARLRVGSDDLAVARARGASREGPRDPAAVVADLVTASPVAAPPARRISLTEPDKARAHLSGDAGAACRLRRACCDEHTIGAGVRGRHGCHVSAVMAVCDTRKVDHEPFAAQICIVKADAQAKVPGVHEPAGAGDCDGAVTEVLEEVVDGAAATLVVDVAAVGPGAVGETEPSPEMLSMTFWL